MSEHTRKVQGTQVRFIVRDSTQIMVATWSPVVIWAISDER